MKKNLLFKIASALLLISPLIKVNAQSYCTPAFSVACSSADYIENFSTTGGSTNITNNLSGCSPVGNYSYITNQNLTTSPGATIGFTVQSGSTFGQGHRIWVDWNDDGDFYDAGEDVWNSGSSGTLAFSGSFVVPVTAAKGTLRMRVRCSYASVPTDPCALQSYGEAEDYDVILPAFSNDAGVASIDSPASFCQGSYNILATIRNFGITQINSVTVNWNFNGVLQTPISYTSLLDTAGGSGSTSAQILLGNKFFTSGVVDNIEVWTSNPNNMADPNPGNDSIVQDKQPSLSGNFTIDPLGSGSTNYLTIAAAVQDLNDFGVCGPVTFTIAPGTYNERMAFKEISGASSTNTITFVADTSGLVTVQYGASSTADNSVVELNGVSWVTLDGIKFQTGSAGSISFRRLFTLTNAKYNTVQNCHLIGYNSTSSAVNYHTLYINGAGNDYNKFNDNIIDANTGYYGVWMYGASGNNAKGNEFNRNEFLNAYQYMLYAYYNTDLKFRNNTFKSTSTIAYGPYFVTSEGELEFVGNIVVTGGIYGLYFSTLSGTPTKSPLIANNWVTSGSTTYTYTMYMVTVSFARIVNNTLWRNNIASSGYYGMYFSGGAANTVVNNLVYCPLGTASYYGIYVGTAAAISLMDNNNVWIPTGYYGYYNAAHSSLAAWNTATGGSNNYNINPGFTKTDSLRHCVDELDNTGMPLEYITKDIDGDNRSLTAPDIGADEFVGSDSSSYSAGPDGELCNGKPVEIGSPITGGTYVWSTSQTTPTIMVTQTGSYTVLFTSSCGGSFSDVVEVTDVTPTAAFDVLSSYQTGKFTNTSFGGGTHRWVVNVTPPDTIWSKDLVYLFDDNGPVEVCLTTYNHCDTVTTCKEWRGFVGVEEGNAENAISVMPNPATDNLSIRFNEIEGDVTVEMHNIQGQVVYTERYMNVTEGSTKSIDVSNLNKGMYLLKLMSNNEVVTKQIVVQ